MADETQTRIDKPTPSGGAYSIAFWVDGDGNPTPKRSAVKLEIVEYAKDDRVLRRTYGTVKP